MDAEVCAPIVTQKAKLLFNKKLHSDAIIVAGKESNIQRFPIHSLILNISSPVFESMLQSCDSNSEIKIPDIDPYAMEAVLRYLYTDEANLTDTDQAINTFKAAQKFHLAQLQLHCRNFMNTSVTPATAAKLFEFAYEFGLPIVLSKCAEQLFRKTKQFLKDKGLHTASQDVVCKILKSSHTIEGNELINSVLEWVEIQSKEKCCGIFEILKPLVPYIYQSHADLFFNTVLERNLLTSLELSSLFAKKTPLLTGSKENQFPLNLHKKTTHIARPLAINDTFELEFWMEIDCFIEAIALPLTSSSNGRDTMNFKIEITDMKSGINYKFEPSVTVSLQTEKDNLAKFILPFPFYIKQRNPMKLEIINLSQSHGLSIVQYTMISGRYEWNGKPLAYIPHSHNSSPECFQISGLLLNF